jgi:hypothetical protein
MIASLSNNRNAHPQSFCARCAAPIGDLTGQQAPEDVVATYASLLDDGDLSVLSLSLQVADHEINLSNIDLVGLSASGLAYS